MAQANRQVGKNLSVFTVGGELLAALIQDATIDFSVTTIDGTCLTEETVGNIANRGDYRISFSLAYDVSAGQISALVDLVGTEVAFSVTAAATGQVYASTGLLHTGTHTIPDGGQVLSFEIIPSGTPLTR